MLTYKILQMTQATQNTLYTKKRSVLEVTTAILSETESLECHIKRSSCMDATFQMNTINSLTTHIVITF